ncbi:cell division topological specificity factor [Betaproteobacteria bacterium]|nr:cell division topological specificity factor [Betaproteobacteria bacterium]
MSSFLIRLRDEFFGEKKKSSAQTAKERLQIVIAHGHDDGHAPAQPVFFKEMQRELLAVISKYYGVEVNPADIKIQFDRQDNLDVLAVNIVLPEHLN